MRIQTTFLAGVAAMGMQAVPVVTPVTTVAIVAFVSTPALARDHSTKLGKGDYYTLIFPEEAVAKLFPDSHPDIHPVTTRDFDVMNITDDSCRVQLPKQAPGLLKDVGLYAVRTAPWSLAAGKLGAIAGNFTPKSSLVTSNGYGYNAGIQMLGGAIGGGINAHETGKHTDVAGCQAAMVTRAQNGGYLNRNVLVVYNVHPARGHPVRRESFPEPAANEAAKVQPNLNPGQAAPPPPAGR